MTDTTALAAYGPDNRPHAFDLERLRSLKKSYDELTPEEKTWCREEEKKCFADPVYFYANYWNPKPIDEQVEWFRLGIERPEIFLWARKYGIALDQIPEFLKKKP